MYVRNLISMRTLCGSEGTGALFFGRGVELCEQHLVIDGIAECEHGGLSDETFRLFILP